MTDNRDECKRKYQTRLLHYLNRSDEAALRSAYELGRKAIVDGIGCLEMVSIHQECLAIALRDANSPAQFIPITAQASKFLAESLSPFEMSLRGFRDTNAQLGQNIRELLAAEADLRQHRDRLLSAEAELREHRDELLAAHQALDLERQRYRDLFDFAPDGYLVADLDGKVVEANRAAEFLFGVPAGGLIGTRLVDLFQEEEREVFGFRMKGMLEGGNGKAEEWQVCIAPRSGESFPVILGVRAGKNAQAEPASLRLLLRDATERMRIEEERAQLLVREQVARAQGEAARRFAFLAEISALLVASFDSDTALGEVASRTVPYLADSCLVFLAAGENGIRLLCGAHADQTRAERAIRLSRAASVPDRRSRIASVLETGVPEIVSLFPADGRKAEAALDPEPLRFLQEEGLASLMMVPMRYGRRVLGLIILASAEEGYFREDHATLAEDLARRCAFSVENARLYRGMAAERDKAAEANRAKDEFLGILGHELRNPLVPILGWARNLKKIQAVTEDSSLRQGTEVIERNALNILRLADDCLDLVRISERKVALEWDLLDLNQIVRDSLDALRLLAQEKGLSLVARLFPEELWVKGDRSRLEQVIYNLLMNAVKYTGKGGLISVGSFRTNDAAEIEIKDTGIGIAPEFLEQVFQPFRRGGREWHTSDASLGLGLAIARKIVELHGGSIWAESPGIGGGSAFRLRLRLGTADDSTASTNPPIAWGKQQTNRLRLLLIDDYKDAAAAMKMELESLGYFVQTATDGQQGLDTAMRVIPDVIISDLKLPKMDGYELMRGLRRVPGLASVPAIALTGLTMKSAFDAALSAGYDAILNKPVDIDELSYLIQKLTIRRRTVDTNR